MKYTYDILDTDVLVIGGGMGGLRAAIRARELVPNVLLVDKAAPARSGASLYVHSQMAPWELSEAEITEWMREFAENTSYLADQEWVGFFLREAPQRIRELEEWGVRFEKNSDGTLKYVTVRGNRVCKTVNADGRQVVEVMRERALKVGVRIVERIAITDLLTSDGRHPTKGNVIGAVGLHARTGQPVIIRAKAVIVATGPVNSKNRQGNCDQLTGDGHIMCYRAGAQLTGMEFCQRAYFCYWERKCQAPGQAKLQGLGARLINARGERVLERYDPDWMEMTSLSNIVRAIICENLEGRGPCYFDMRHFSEEDVATLRRVTPFLTKAFDEFGIDIRRQVAQSDAFASLGSTHGLGVLLDMNAATNIGGLFVVGYAGCLMGNMSGSFASFPSTFAHVSGHRAGEVAARVAQETSKAELDMSQVRALLSEQYAFGERNTDVRPYDVFREIWRLTVPASFSFFKTEANIKQVMGGLKKIREEMLPQVSAPDAHELVKANEARSYVSVAELCCLAALERKESRGPHYRRDYPFRDDENWLKWIILERDGEGEGVKITYRPLPFDRYRIKPSKLEKIPINYYVPSGIR